MAKTLGCIEILDDEQVSFADLIESPDTVRMVTTKDIHVIANLPALQADLRSLFFELTDDIGRDW